MSGDQELQSREEAPRRSHQVICERWVVWKVCAKEGQMCSSGSILQQCGRQPPLSAGLCGPAPKHLGRGSLAAVNLVDSDPISSSACHAAAPSHCNCILLFLTVEQHQLLERCLVLLSATITWLLQPTWHICLLDVTQPTLLTAEHVYWHQAAAGLPLGSHLPRRQQWPDRACPHNDCTRRPATTAAEGRWCGGLLFA